jgi:uracil phosphoribosyltransferase
MAPLPASLPRRPLDGYSASGSSWKTRAAVLDSHPNEHGRIVPDLGHAGDRLFGTK